MSITRRTLRSTSCVSGSPMSESGIMPSIFNLRALSKGSSRAYSFSVSGLPLRS